MDSEKSKSRFGIDIEELIPRVTEEVAAKMRENAMTALSYQVQHAVSTAISKYIEDNIIPSVRQELAAHEAEIRAAFVAGIKGACVALAERIEKDAAEKMASYNGNDLLKSVVNSLWGSGY